MSFCQGVVGYVFCASFQHESHRSYSYLEQLFLRDKRVIFVDMRSCKRKVALFFVKSVKKVEASRGLQKDSKKKLSQILRTEAAVRGIEKKADSAKSSRLWPKAVLEALDDSIDNNQWESALKIFKLLRKQHWYHPKCQTYTKLLRMLGKCKQPEQASSLFQMMLYEGLKPTIDVYTSLVGVYGSSGLFKKAFSIIDQMKSVTDCKPDVYTYTVLISCCSKLRQFDLIGRVLIEMSYLGIECNSVTFNAIINGYGKAGMFELMENSLSSMIETGRCLPDVFTMNSFIWAYGNDGLIEQMEKWFEEFQHMGVKPDIKTFNVLIKSYGKAGMYDKMDSVLEFMKKRFFSPTIVTFNIIIETFGKSGNIGKMEFYFQLMKSQGIKPNSVTYCSLVNNYSKARLLKKVHTVWRQIENSDVVLDTPFFNCIISAYGQAGEMRRMEEMFSLMKEKKCVPDDITFATMIQVYNEHGMFEAARELEALSNMKGTIQDAG